MFSTVLGLFSQDLAVDPGTARTRVWMRGAGVVAETATLVAVTTNARGRREVHALGDDVLPWVGRTGDDLELVEPIREGRIHDYGVAEAFLLHLFRRIHGRNTWMRPRLVVPAPGAASPMELRALRDSCEAAGARDVTLVPRPIAAALGAGLATSDPHGQLVIELGAGSTELAVIALDRVVASRSIPGGRACDQAVVDRVRLDHDLLIPLATAQRLKEELGAACEAEARSLVVAGRCARTGLPRAAEVLADEVCRALAPHVLALRDATADVLRAVPNALAHDVAARGLVLTGAGARLRDLDRALWRSTGLPALVAAEPDRSVIRGVGRVLEATELQEAVAC